MKKATIELPKPLRETDLKSYVKNDRAVEFLDLYYTERFGWVIATLHIRNASRRFRENYAAYADNARTYAIAISDGQICRVGLGPHVKSHAHIYVRESRKAALQSLIDLKNRGESEANNIRDRISTRRMRGSMRGNGWY